MTTRQFNESGLTQGTDERIAYRFDTTPWGTTPSNPVVTVWDVTTGTDVNVTVAKTSGAASVTGNVITTPLIVALVLGSTYRVEVKFETGGNTLEAWMTVTGDV